MSPLLTSTYSAPRSLNRWMRLPLGWNYEWLRAVGNRANEIANFVVIGDSLSEGYQTSNWFTKRWSHVIRSSLLTKYGASALAGDFYHVTLNADYTTTPGTPPFSKPSGAPTATWTGGGYNRNPRWTGAVTATNMLQFVTPAACTDIDVVYSEFLASGTWTYTVDGGATQTVTLPASTLLSGTQAKLKLTGLSNVTHTLLFNGQSATDSFRPHGVTCWNNRNAGLGFANMSVTSAPVADWLPSANVPTDMPSQLQGPGPKFTVTAATTATPIVVTTNTTHGFVTGNQVQISGGTGMTVINGQWTITVLSTTTFSLNGSVGSGTYTASSAKVQLWVGFGFPVEPNLMILMQMGNDCILNLGIDGVREAYRRLIQAARRGRDHCSILIVISPLGEPTSGDVTFPTDNIESWPTYVDAMENLAADFDCGIYNLYADLGEYEWTRGYSVSQGDFHLNDAGHAYLASQITPLIMGNP